MNRKLEPMETRLRLSATFVVVGLAIESATLLRVHALAFLSFMFVGGTCLAVGFTIYLYSLLATAPEQSHMH